MLAIKYREVNAKGEMSGGPMYTMKKAFKHKKFGAVLGWLFALFAVIASFGIGNMTQANSISESLSSTFSVPTYVTGIILTVFALLIIVGGIKTISKVSSVVVPLMAIFYVVAGLIVIIVNIQNLPAGVVMIFKMAFSVKAVGGGLCGTITAAMMNAMRFGVARGVFSNEAGMGSAAITAAAATTDNPVRQGYINMTGTFWDTIVVCTITGLCIASSGVLGITENSTKGSYQVSGTEVTVEAVDSDNKITTTDYTYEFTDDQLILTDTSNSSNTLTLSVLSSDELNKDENTKLASELAVEESQAAIGSLTGTWTDAAGNHYTFAEDGIFACSTVIKGAASHDPVIWLCTWQGGRLARNYRNCALRILHDPWMGVSRREGVRVPVQVAQVQYDIQDSVLARCIRRRDDITGSCMELLRYSECAHGDSEPYLPAGIKRRDRKGYKGIPGGYQGRESIKVEY